jgi:uncharacterized protein (DUF302 family)
MFKHLMAALVAAAFLIISSGQASAAARTQGVYVKVFEGMKADINDTGKKAEAALKGAGFEVLAAYDNGVPEGCKMRAMTIVFTKPAYAEKVLSGGPEKGFALPLRLGLYEDEAGLNAALTNPVSIDRTIFQGNSMDEPAQKVVDEVIAALKTVGPTVDKQIGQIRDTGDITGMGGGPFPEKVVKAASSGKAPSAVADALKKISNKAGWHMVYEYKVSDNVSIVGLTNFKTEGRAFGIAGEARASKANKFPGIDHAAAFPIEVVIYKSGGATTAAILKEMWRMKLYFQDAGNWAFMKNMGMPGQIQDELTAEINNALK